MNNISIAFAVNKNYAEHLYIAIYSLLLNNKDSRIDIYVLQKDFTSREMKVLNKIDSHFSNAHITLVDMKDKMYLFNDISLVIDYITIETYFRFILPDLFIDIDKIIYIDADTLVVGKIDNLWSTDLSECYIAGVEDPLIVANEYKKEIGFSESDLYVNAGVLVMNLRKMRKDGVVDSLFKGLKKYPAIRYQDQDIINITLINKIKKIDIIFNFMWDYQQEYRDKYNDAVIVHYTGASKPWLSYGLNFRPFWFYEYDQYVDSFEREMRGLEDNRVEKYGLYTYETENVGDDIQSIAARQYLPRIDYYVDRDNIDGTNYKDASKVKLIMNGWYTHKPMNWPPLSRKIEPLFIAMYFSSKHNNSVMRAVLSKQSLNFFKINGKVGSRDLTTNDYLLKNGIDSYFSGCLTLTIHKEPKIQKQDYIVAVDVSDAVLETMKRNTNREIIKITPEIMTKIMEPEYRLKIAEWFLAVLQSAHCVVATRLHSVLPSLALETPVLFILNDNHRETDRFKGLIELTNHMTDHEYTNNYKKYNLDNPKQNPTKYLSLRNNLIKSCKNYTGYMNNTGYLNSYLPFQLHDTDAIQGFFDALHGAYRYQNIHDILTGRSEYASTEIEEWALRLRSIESENSELIKYNNELLEIKKKYEKIIKVPRSIRNKIRRHP